MYRIKSRTYNIAERLGIKIRASQRAEKKIDILIPTSKGFRVISVGQIGYFDYPTYLELERVGKIERGTAAARKRAYEKRHRKDLSKKGTAGYYAYMLLWT